MVAGTRTTRTYEHFCALARALEQVGDRWTLLVVRDLLTGPRRFTDLMDLLGGITPKTLTQRLRELEAAGVVAADREPGRREVWYRLTAAGEELAPVVRALFHWGVRHNLRPRAPGEKVHPEHLLKALLMVLDDAEPPRRAVRWQFELSDGATYTLTHDGTWSLSVGRHGEPDVTVASHRDGLVRYLLGRSDDRTASSHAVELRGNQRAITEFTRLLRHFPPASVAP